MSLQGKREMQRRLKALRLSFKPIGKDWADDFVRLGKPRIPVATGKTRRVMRVRNANQRRATVVGSHVAYFIDKGTVPHTIRAKRTGTLAFKAKQGHTVFARSVHHRGQRARPFRQRTADEALRRNPMAKTVIAQYNKAA
jgi:hypothetical protein